MQRDFEIERARQVVAAWLQEWDAAVEDFDFNEKRNVPQGTPALVECFFAIANRRGFSWTLLKSGERYVVRWSHPRCSAAGIPVAESRPGRQEAAWKVPPRP